ncbi:mucosa-associated lymphoid tissue lymphoma translocation protein 1-like [Hydractinia symbiolongicarpus]|uniref:mucosa-associated lymphoid tissue lymphoma translocation protein 1-like n=1 Tax=Hydractinia symbiolongicarpus TaxID=13093 RepID=UPI00254D8F0E|nr:mucosa-associated lymphoid tissue lymphoma translocation protein 1-like [Hydractinia symbiolongicarpus]
MPTLLSEVPKIEEHPKSCVVELGDDVCLMCKATGKNLQFKWFKNSRCLSNERGSKLHLHKVTLQNAGRYSCLVSNNKESLLTWAIVDVLTIVNKNRMLF